jgi:hypothetical protein
MTVVSGFSRTVNLEVAEALDTTEVHRRFRGRPERREASRPPFLVTPSIVVCHIECCIR